MPLKGAKKKHYNKKYYEENKEKIAEKNSLIIEKMLKKVAPIVQHKAGRVT